MCPLPSLFSRIILTQDDPFMPFPLFKSHFDSHKSLCFVPKTISCLLRVFVFADLMISMSICVMARAWCSFMFLL